VNILIDFETVLQLNANDTIYHISLLSKFRYFCLAQNLLKTISRSDQMERNKYECTMDQEMAGAAAYSGANKSTILWC